MSASDRKGSARSSSAKAASARGQSGKTGSGKGKPSAADAEAAPRRAWIAAIAGWLVPGLGHFLLGRRGRAAIFAALVFSAIVIGCSLDGQLYTLLRGQPFSVLGTAASMGMGLPYFILRWGMGYQGVVAEIGYDYGKAFLLTAGLMNCLLVLDAWDIACGRKE